MNSCYYSSSMSGGTAAPNASVDFSQHFSMAQAALNSFLFICVLA